MLVRIGLGRVTVTLMAGRFRLRLRAALCFLDFRNEWLARNGSESERTGEDKPKQESKRRSHRGAVYHRSARTFNSHLVRTLEWRGKN